MSPARIGPASARAVLLALAMGGAAVPAHAAPGALEVRAEPATVLLGSGARARIEIEGADEVPSVTTSVGRIEDLRPAGPGRFTATYVPPGEAYPQVAIVSAVARGRGAAVALPLVGRGVAIARSRPGSEIRVTIGEASFGPAVADRGGEARVPVIAPPGVRFARHGDRLLDLEIPPTLHVQVALDARAAAADAPRDVALWAFAVAPDGAPREGALLALEVSEGRVEGLAEIAPGTFSGTWRLGPGPAGEAAVTARLADEPGPARRVTLDRPAGPPGRVAIRGERRRAVAGEETPIALHVTVTDAAGNPVDLYPALSATAGSLARPRPTGPGAWESEYLAPRNVGAGRTVAVVARAGGVEDQLELELAPDAVERLEVAPSAPALVADGDAEVLVHVRVLDRFDNPVPAQPPEVVATLPAGIASEPDRAGTWTVRYKPFRRRETATERLAIRVAGLEGVARVEVVAPERRLALAPKVGLAASRAGVRSPYLAAEASYRTRLLAGRLGVALELGTFTHDRTDVVPVGVAGVDVRGRARYVALLASARWWLAPSDRWTAWVDAGGGGAVVDAAVAAGTAPAAQETGLVPAVHAGAGAGLRLGHGAPFVEARVDRYGAPSLDRLRGPLSVLTLALGWRHDAY